MTTTSKLQRLRHAIRMDLVDAGLWEDHQILTERVGDFWNSVAAALAQAQNRLVLVISEAEGTVTEDNGLEQDLTIVLSIVAEFTTTPGETPEEAIWERTIEWLHNKVLSYEGGPQHWAYRMRYQGFRDASELLPDSDLPANFVRQSTFAVKMSLQPKN